MKKFHIFNSYEYEKIKAIEENKKNSYFGFIYILEYGKNVKIGYSKNPVIRIKSFKKQAEYADCKIGNVAISKPHTNYIKNEKLLHEYFKQHRISGTELFSMTLKQALSDFPDDLKFLDESEILTQQYEQGFENLKKFISVDEITTSDNALLLQIIENQMSLEQNQKRMEQKIDMLEKAIRTLDKKVDTVDKKSDNILKTLFDMSRDVISNGMQIIYNKFFPDGK